MGRERDSAAQAFTVCWQCKARMRPEQLICTRCGATRPTAQMRAIAAKDPLADLFRGDVSSWREDVRTQAPTYVPGGEPSHGIDHPPAQLDPEPAMYTPSAPPAAPVAEIASPPQQGSSLVSAPASFILPVSALTSFVPPVVRNLGRAFFEETAEVWRATGFACLGALIGGGLWLGVALSVHYESGFLAIPLGLLVGEGVAIGATVRRHRYALYALGLVVFFWAICIRLLAAHQLMWSPLDSAYLFFALMGCTVPVDRLPLRSFARRMKSRQTQM